MENYSLQDAADRLEELEKFAPYLRGVGRRATFKWFPYNRTLGAKTTTFTLGCAGWISSSSSPTSAKCPFCRLELAFDSDDDPWELHKEQSPKCEFVLLDKLFDSMWTLRDFVHMAIRCATNEKYEEFMKLIKQSEHPDDHHGFFAFYPLSRSQATEKLLELRDKPQYLTYDRRLASFGKFMYDGIGANCTSKKLAKAGWHNLPDPNTTLASVKCPFCLLEVEFEESDDPWEEHKKRGPSCDFVKLGKLKEGLWTTEEALNLSVRIMVMERYEMVLWLVDEMETEQRLDDISKMMKVFMKKGRNDTVP